jgi:hypothetical protein
MKFAYRVATQEEVKHPEEYSVLLGPNGFECWLGEPEDRAWYRDGSEAVERLNKLHTFIQYWSYCTRMGMLKYCPEKKEELIESLRNLGIDVP